MTDIKSDYDFYSQREVVPEEAKEEEVKFEELDLLFSNEDLEEIVVYEIELP